MKKTIVVFNLNETTSDPRVRRIATSLATMGHRVIVLNPQSESAPPQETHQGFEIHRIKFPGGYTEEDAMRFARECPPLARLAAKHDSRILSTGFGKKFVSKVQRRASMWLRKKGLVRAPTQEASQPFDLLQDAMGIRWILVANWALYSKALEFKPDLAWSNDLDTLVCGYLLKTRIGTPLVFDAHEIYPEQFPVHMRSDLWHDFYSELERDLLQHTDGCLTVCDSLGEYFVRAYKSKPFVTIRNCPSRRLFAPSSVLQRKSSPRTVLYHGAYFRYRGLDEVIQASMYVKNCRFVFRGLGDHESALRALSQSIGASDRVEFAAPVAVDDLISSASACDIGLSPFISVCLNTEFALPNKFFEYAAAGLALVSADLPEMRRLTNTYRMGRLYDSSDPKKLADVLNELLAAPEQLDEYRAHAYEAAVQNFTWEKEQESLVAFVRQVTGSGAMH